MAMTTTLPGLLVDTDWLAAHLDAPDLVVLDARFTMPGVSPDGAALYAQAHLPGARFFDIDHVSDPSQALPHMLPQPDDFARIAGTLGIADGTPVVVYDGPGLMSAPRAWWTLRVFGHDNVAVLDGGLRKWQAEGREVTGRVPPAGDARFTPAFRPELVRDRQAVLDNLGSRAAQVIDARAADRFQGSVPEVRPGLRSGHVPGSLNLPFNRLSDPQTGQVLAPEALAAVFREAGLDPDADRPIIASCGSGVTAGVLAFGLALLGRGDVAVYDGSWTEWGQPGNTPVETGPSR